MSQTELAAFSQNAIFTRGNNGEKIFFNERKCVVFQEKKKKTVFIDNIQTFQPKFESWNTRIHHHELNSFPILGNTSSEVEGNTKECDF